jgi:hypothetical protein
VTAAHTAAATAIAAAGSATALTTALFALLLLSRSSCVKALSSRQHDPLSC